MSQEKIDDERHFIYRILLPRKTFSARVFLYSETKTM